MEKKLIEALQLKFVGADVKTLERIAAKLAKTTQDTEDDIKTAVDGVTFAQVMENYGDARATAAAATAVKGYETKHNLKDGKPVESPEPTKPTTDPATMPDWAKALVESNKALQEQISGFKAKEVTASRVAKLDEMLKDAPETIQAMFKRNFAAMSFADDAAFEAWQTEQTPIIEGLVNDLKAKGATIKPPMTGGTRKPGEADPLVVARAEKQAEAAKAAPSVFRGAGAK